jgi:beta-glucanase (GH16 family)
MKHVKSLFAVFVMVISTLSGCGPSPSAHPPSPPPYAPVAGKSWHLTWAEEFNGNSLDTSKLSPCNPWSTGTAFGQCGASFNTGREYYQPNQVQVHNGIASLVAQPLSPSYSSTACYNSTCDYVSGEVSGAQFPGNPPGQPFKFAYTYGYLEARIKLPKQTGFFSAFWLLQASPQPNAIYNWEDDTEILGGIPQMIYMTHQNNRKSACRGGQGCYRINYNNTSASWGYPPTPYNNGTCPGGTFDYSQDWHTFAIDWEPTYVNWYIDRQLCGGYSDPTGTNIPPSTVSMFPLIQLMVDTGWQRSVAKTTGASGVSDHLDVDYLRLWQQQ